MSRNSQQLITVRIAEIVEESSDVKTFTLEPTEADQHFSYEAGQFLTLRLPVAGSEPITRTYSISTCPVSDPRLAFTVKRAEGGVGSNWLYERAEVGMILHTYPPAGQFTLDRSSSAIHLFAAGVGITPIIALCKYALASTSRPVRLHYSSRTPNGIPFHSEIISLQERHPDQLVAEIHSSNEAGRVGQRQISRTTARDHEAVSYVCGPTGYTQMVTDALLAAERPQETIRTESFGPSPRQAAMTSTSAPSSTAFVRVRGREAAVPWPVDIPLIEALDAAGVDAPSSCRQGDCLTCECRISSGKAMMRKNNVLDEDDIEDGYALACQLLPIDSEVTVEFS